MTHKLTSTIYTDFDLHEYMLLVHSLTHLTEIAPIYISKQYYVLIILLTRMIKIIFN